MGERYGWRYIGKERVRERENKTKRQRAKAEVRMGEGVKCRAKEGGRLGREEGREKERGRGIVREES